MMHPEAIETLIRQGMSCTHVEVDGDGRHFEAVVVSAELAGKSRVQRQQRVYETVRAQLDSGELHALSLKTYTPEEWSARG
ncbi:BolA family protein [Azovibrio restrictus]|uniref:BolA family protein n=1 Tax=Azovibrio restrictus TaxID=146938 RepID=UPI0026EBD9B2|nr:BolA family protein [Azovibrio restrictus]